MKSVDTKTHISNIKFFKDTYVYCKIRFVVEQIEHCLDDVSYGSNGQHKSLFHYSICIKVTNYESLR